VCYCVAPLNGHVARTPIFGPHAQKLLELPPEVAKAFWRWLRETGEGSGV